LRIKTPNRDCLGIIAISIFIIWSTSIPSSAGFDEFDGWLYGTVTNANSDPIQGASISIEEMSTLTDAIGNYIVNHPPGTYDVTISAVGYTQAFFSGISIIEMESKRLDSVLALTNVNNPPVMSSIEDQTTSDNQETDPISFIIADSETDTDQLSIEVNISNKTLVPSENIIVSGTGASRTLTITPVLNGKGTSFVTITVSDGEKFCSETFLLTVNDLTLPTATLRYSTTDTTNQDVTATITPSEIVTITNNQGMPSHTFTENGELVFEFKDTSGNTGTAKAMVDWIDKTAPIAVLADVPSGKLYSDSVNITVSGTDVTHYKYKLDNETYSQKTDIDKKIQLTDLAEGPHIISVIGSDIVGNWQPQSNVTKAEWENEIVIPVDFNQDKSINLIDVTIGLKVLSVHGNQPINIPTYIIDDNGALGIDEITYALQEISSAWYKDLDQDRYSDGGLTRSRLKPDGYYYKSSELISIGGDCNDTNSNIHPGAAEICGDGIDQDCNGMDLSCPSTWYKDSDGDGYSNSLEKVQVSQPEGYYLAKDLISIMGDCNDINSNIHPGAAEICGDGIDQDCNGMDLSCPSTWYKDSDGDGYSNSLEKVQVSQPEGYYLAKDLISIMGDCNDINSNIHPGAAEICGDGIDQDCSNGDQLCKYDWYKDSDKDRYSDGTSKSSTFQPSGYYLANDLTATSGDCDDNDASTHPGATEVCGDNIDQDCSNGDLLCVLNWYKDSDGDGYSDGKLKTQATQPSDYYLAGDLKANSGDCLDNNPTAYPGAVETCGDGIDQDCSGQDKQCPDPNQYVGKWSALESVTGTSYGTMWAFLEITIDKFGNFNGIYEPYILLFCPTTWSCIYTRSWIKAPAVGSIDFDKRTGVLNVIGINQENFIIKSLSANEISIELENEIYNDHGKKIIIKKE